MKKKILILAFIIFSVAFTSYLYFDAQNKKNIISLYGNIEIRQVDLSFRISGKIKKLNVDEGDEVKAGDILAILDEQPVNDKLNLAMAELEKSKATYANAVETFKMNREACLDQTVSRISCKNIETSKKEANAGLLGAKARVGEATTAMRDTKLTAPNDGMILTRVQEKGAVIEAGMPVFTLSLTKPIWARCYLSEKDLGKVKVGTITQVYTDAKPNAPYLGRITFISPVAEFTPKTVETTSLRPDLVYRTKVLIEAEDNTLKQGMPVTVKINLKKDKE